VIVDFDNLNQTPFYNIYSSLVYATKADNVRDVVINGKPVMLNRRLLTLDENVIKKDANLYREKIINSLKSK
jgi:5-methylthioadenosine/S-adenosylhomocysteine deaminase